MRVVVAPDSFKGSLGAAAAAEAIAAGWRRERPSDEVVELPLADGGEGTLDVLARTLPGVTWHKARVSGPSVGSVATRWLELPGGEHVVELAQAAGLPLLAEPDPLGAHTTGVGELIARALDAGAERILVGLGGSASTDGGTGLLAALGARFTDAAGRLIGRGGGSLARLAAVDLSGLRPAPPGGVRCLADVCAPLLGASGSARVFGPQKGADPQQAELLEAGLARLAAVLGGEPTAKGAGAAGGTGYGLAAAWGAELVPGGAEIARVSGLAAQLAGSGVVITGEGRFDATSLGGKVVGEVIASARRIGVPVAVVAGQIAEPPPAWRALALADLAGDPVVARRDASLWLARAGESLAREVGTAELAGRRPSGIGGQVPADDHGDFPLVPERANRAGIQAEQRTGRRFEAEPPCGQHAQHVTMGDKGDVTVAQQGSGTAEHGVGPGGHRRQRLARMGGVTRDHAVTPDQPAGALRPDLSGSTSLVAPIIPFL